MFIYLTVNSDPKFGQHRLQVFSIQRILDERQLRVNKLTRLGACLKIEVERSSRISYLYIVNVN